MTGANLPPEAIVDGRTFTDENVLHGFLSRLRREDPLPFIDVEGFPSFWLVSRYDDIVRIETDAEHFINAPRQAVMPLANEQRTKELSGGDIKETMRNLTAMDGDEHKAYRAIAQSRFLGKALLQIREDIQKIAKEFVDRMESYGDECDFAQDVAVWYPLRVIMSILGAPAEDEKLILRLTQQVLTGEDPEMKRKGEKGTLAAALELFEYFKPIIDDRRANPTDDIASVVANARIDGEYLPDRDVFGYFLIIATAGHDTTSFSLTGGLLALLQRPDQLERLMEDDSLLPTAVDEMIRWSTPVRHFCRTATEDCEIRGKQIKAGDLMLLSYPSANRDEDHFEDPQEFKLDRLPNRHLAFGTGPHVCLGQHLARLELTSFFRELLPRLEHVELNGTPRFVEATFVGGVKYLPIKYRLKQAILQPA